MPNFSPQWLKALQVDLRIRVHEAPPGRRLQMRTKQWVKYFLAAALHMTGLTGLLLRRGLLRANASLILGYHGVSEGPPGFLSRGHSTSNLQDHLRFLKRYLRPVPLDVIALAVSRGESPPPASFAVTFDDGLINNVQLAIPLLRQMDLPAVFFVPSRLVGSPEDLWLSSLREILYCSEETRIVEEPGCWPELRLSDEQSRHAAYFKIKQVLKGSEEGRQELLARLASRMGGTRRPPQGDRVVDEEMLRQMAAPGFCVGAHSRTHPIFAALTPEAAREEIEGSRKDLERMVGRPVLDFAYPNGRFPDFNDVTCRLVAEAGYRCAVTTEPGTVRRGDDRLALRRCLPGNVPVFLASFELLIRVWGDRNRPGDLTQPVRNRLSYLARPEVRSAA